MMMFGDTVLVVLQDTIISHNFILIVCFYTLIAVVTHSITGSDISEF